MAKWGLVLGVWALFCIAYGIFQLPPADEPITLLGVMALFNILAGAVIIAGLLGWYSREMRRILAKIRKLVRLRRSFHG